MGLVPELMFAKQRIFFKEYFLLYIFMKLGPSDVQSKVEIKI